MSKFKLCITGDLGFEFWKDIPGYEGLYQVSTYGKIKNMQGVVLKTYYGNKGYELIKLTKNKETKGVLVSRAVAAAFIPKWKAEYTQCNHINERKNENFVWNLEYVSPSMNANWGTRNKRIRESQGKKVLQIDIKTGAIINEYTSAQEATDVTKIGHVSAVCRGERNQAGGFKWEYA